MVPVVDGTDLPADLAQFAAEAVASGRFRDLDDVLRTGVDRLRRREYARAACIASLEEAQAEARRDGVFTIDEVAAELDQIIAEAEHNQT